MTHYLPSFFRFGLRVLSLLLLLATSLLAQAQTIRYVRIDGPNANPATATTWATSTANLQGAINASAAGDQVWVAQGTYKPGGNTNTSRNVSFSMKNGVTIYGGFAGTEDNLSQRVPANALATILSGDIGTVGNATDNSYVVISNPPGLTNSAVLDGFLITGGTGINNSGGMYNNGRGDYGSTSSSGIVCSPTVRNCLFQGNSSINGAGAMFNDGRNYGASSPVLINCSFQNNSTINGGGAMTINGSDGGTSSLVMTNCSFLNNTSSSSAGAIYSEGYGGTSNSVMTNCIVFGNKGNGGRVNSSIYTSGARILATYSLFETGIFGYSDGGNNRTTAVSPFVSNTDARLNACSPAIDAGNSAANTTATDLAGNPRVYQNGRIDMGAYEYQGTPSQPLTLTNPSQSATTVCAGDLVRFSVTPAGTGPFNATLYRDNAEVVRETQAPAGLEIRATIVSTQSGTYQFVVTSACNSVTTTYASITVNPLPTQYAVTGGGSYCQGGAGVVVGLSGSQTGVNYQLQRDGNAVGSPVAGTGSALSFGAQTSAGNYTVQATNASTTCQQTMTGSAIVTQNPLPTQFSVTGGGSYCAGGSGVAVGLSGSQTGVSYQLRLDGNAVGNAVAGTGSAISFGSQTAAGAYTVQAINTSTTCQQTMSSSATITVNPLPTPGLTNNGPLSCTMTTVTLTATGAAGVSGSSYTFTDGNGQVLTGTGDTRLVSSPGTYTVRVASEAGCTNTTTTTVTSNTVVVTATLSASPSTTLTCSQPTLTLTASGGDTYRFSDNVASQTSNQVTVVQAGVYSVTAISTATGCFNTASITISQDNAAPSASLASSGPISCAVTSATLTASPIGQSYRFSDGATPIGSTNQATVTTAGPYSVTVISANGCSSVATVTVTEDQTPPTVSISPSTATLTCANPSATLTVVGTGSFRWSTGAQTASIGATTADTYSVTVTGSNGCSATTSALVSSDQTAPSVTITPTSGTLTCASPTLTLTANTNAPTLRWSNGQTTPSITVNASGTYSVTATGANGCQATSNAVRIESAQDVPPATLVATSGLSCAVTSVTLTANTGSELSYRFSSGATQLGSGNTATVNASGTYSVTVTNTATGCTNIASVVVSQDNSQPTVSISPTTATLSCAVPTATLTANSSASSLTWSTVQTTNSISVNVAGTYSVTVTSANGCKAVAQATVSGTADAPTAPTLAASPAPTTAGQPITVTASGCPAGTITWTAQGGIGQASGNTYILTQPGNYTLSATCSLNGCISGSSSPLIVQIRPGGFAITGVSMVNCQLTSPDRGEYRVQFSPQYTGQNANPISFSVVNELVATTAPAPYTLRLYTDNPVITLVATQAGNGEARFAYNWRASCQSGTSPNQPPTTTGVPDQTIVQGQAYQLQLTNYVADPDGQALTFQASGLPAGLNLSGSVISGTPAQTGVSTVTVTALDPGGLQVSTSFRLTVSPTPVTPPSGFAIVGVSTVQCQVIGAGERQLTFTPQYTGVSGAPISFSVVNELRPTTAPGPYTLRLYTDNPAITLSAQQGSSVSTYRYNWLAVCNPAGRVGQGELESALVVRVLGNPVQGNTVEVEISGVNGQPVQLNLTDMQGKPVHAQRIDQAGTVDRVRLPLGVANGQLLLQVSTPTQRQVVKLLKQ